MVESDPSCDAGVVMWKIFNALQIENVEHMAGFVQDLSDWRRQEYEIYQQTMEEKIRQEEIAQFLEEKKATDVSVSIAVFFVCSKWLYNLR